MNHLRQTGIHLRTFLTPFLFIQYFFFGMLGMWKKSPIKYVTENKVFLRIQRTRCQFSTHMKQPRKLKGNSKSNIITLQSFYLKQVDRQSL